MTSTSKVKLPRETYTVTVSTTNDTQLCKAPWMNSKNGTLRLKKLIITNKHATADATVTFWDQDLDSTTPGSYGSNSAGLLSVVVGGIDSIGSANPLILSELQCPNIQFIAGIAVDTDNTTLSVTAEVEIEIL
jgi:hypothetical protein